MHAGREDKGKSVKTTADGGETPDSPGLDALIETRGALAERAMFAVSVSCVSWGLRSLSVGLSGRSARSADLDNY